MRFQQLRAQTAPEPTVSGDPSRTPLIRPAALQVAPRQHRGDAEQHQEQQVQQQGRDRRLGAIRLRVHGAMILKCHRASGERRGFDPQRTPDPSGARSDPRRESVGEHRRDE